MATRTRELEQQVRRIQPRSAVYLENGKVLLTIEMPGMAREDVTITVANDELHIHGKRRESEQQGSYVIRERTQGDYYHAFTLDDTIDREKIEAKMQRGVLTLTLEQKEASKPKQITVREI
jgi:HSP20 family protein